MTDAWMPCYPSPATPPPANPQNAPARGRRGGAGAFYFYLLFSPDLDEAAAVIGAVTSHQTADPGQRVEVNMAAVLRYPADIWGRRRRTCVGA